MGRDYSFKFYFVRKMNKGYIDDKLTGHGSNYPRYPVVTGLQSSVVLGDEFYDDPLAVEKYLTTFRRQEYLEPEKGLMLAVLKDAISIYQKHVIPRNQREKKLFREAEEWILKKKTNNYWPFSFDNICEALGLDPSYVREGITKWKSKPLYGKMSKVE